MERALDQRDPRWVDAWARLIGSQLVRWLRGRAEGLERIPRGPALLVGNHSGGKSIADGIFAVKYVETFGPEAPLYILVHRMFATTAPVREGLARLGLIAGTPEHAGRALERGAHVLVYPGADHDAMRPYSRRADVDLGGRRGFIRIAARAGVPIVPVATAGSHDTFVVLAQGKPLASALGFPRILGLHSFPLILCLPYGVLAGPMCLLPHFPLPARVEVEVLEPMVIDPALADAPDSDPRLTACYLRIEARLRAAVGDLYRRRARTWR